MPFIYSVILFYHLQCRTVQDFIYSLYSLYFGICWYIMSSHSTTIHELRAPQETNDLEGTIKSEKPSQDDVEIAPTSPPMVNRPTGISWYMLWLGQYLLAFCFGRHPLSQSSNLKLTTLSRT